MKARYDCTCSECGHEFQAAPSIMMSLGQNTGHGSCSQCKTFLHLEIHPNLDGEKMVSMSHSNWVEEVKNE